MNQWTWACATPAARGGRNHSRGDWPERSATGAAPRTNGYKSELPQSEIAFLSQPACSLTIISMSTEFITKVSMNSFNATEPLCCKLIAFPPMSEYFDLAKWFHVTSAFHPRHKQVAHHFSYLSLPLAITRKFIIRWYVIRFYKRSTEPSNGQGRV